MSEETSLSALAETKVVSTEVTPSLAQETLSLSPSHGATEEQRFDIDVGQKLICLASHSISLAILTRMIAGIREKQKISKLLKRGFGPVNLSVENVELTVSMLLQNSVVHSESV